MVDMCDHYNQELPTQNRGIHLRQQQRRWNARLTPDAWRRFNEYEKRLLDAGVASERPEILTPVYDRLGKSTLKTATLIAAAGTREDIIHVTEEDIVHAISYATRWREYAIDIINGVGRTASETQITRMHELVTKRPGVSRSEVMQRFHLMAREASALFDTMEQRGLITSSKVGQATMFYPLETRSE
jgi:hypothetical protein